MSQLEIVIPTYNRPDCIDYILNELKKQQDIKYDYIVSIYDSSTNEDTENIVCKCGNSNINYYKMSPDIDVDEKTLLAMKKATANYVLLCGDGILINIEEIFNRFDFSSINSDLICIYSPDSSTTKPYYKDWKDKIYDDKLAFWMDNFTQMTLYGGSICKREIIQRIDIENSIDLYKGKNFIYPCTLARYSGASCERIVGNYYKKVPYKKYPGWIGGKNALQVWSVNFVESMHTLDEIFGKENIDKLIIENGVRTQFFTIRGLIWLKSSGNYSFALYNKYKPYIKVCSKLSTFSLFFVSIIPKNLCVLMRKLYRKIKGRPAEFE